MQVPHESKEKTSESLQKMPECPEQKQTKRRNREEIFDLRHVPFYQYHSYLN